jgi:RNA polymerase sigma-70 factor (ECF subfamily)
MLLRENGMPHRSDPSDEELIRRVSSGDAAAAADLFDRHAAALRANVRRRLPASMRGKIGESDVLQEAWLAAFMNLGKFEDRGDGSFAAWLRRILDRKLIDEVRRHTDAAIRDARREERLATDAGVAAPDQPSPSEEVAAAEQSARVKAVVEGLPSDYAVVVRLIHQDGLTLVEAGERIGRSADAVRKLYGRALACLVDRVGGLETTDG